jgi:IclR family acetate operon transcriptional repressor
MADSPSETIRSVSNALTVMEAFKPDETIGVSDLARRVGLPKTTTQRILQTLQAAGWVSSSGAPQTRWGPSAKFLAIGSRLSQGWGLRMVATPIMHELRDSTSETVTLVVPQGTQVVYLDRAESREMIRATTVPGSVQSILKSTGGKAILAEMPEAQARALLGNDLPRHTEFTITNIDRMMENLREARRIGYAVSWQEWHIDVVGVGAAIKDATGSPIAAISMIIPAVRASKERVTKELGPMVAQAARAISSRLNSAH